MHNLTAPEQLSPFATANPAKVIRREFEANGFFHARNIFSAEELRELEEDFDHIVAQLQGSGEEINARWTGPEMEKLGAAKTTIFHTHNVQQYSARWLAALLQPNFRHVLTAILGENVVLHHTKLFQKPSENGAPFPMHQDWSYFPSELDTMIAGIIHVSDADDEMGCLRVYPGSHRLGRVEGTNGMTAASDLLRDYPLDNAQPVEARAGDVVFFHYFTLHGSMPNVSQRVRKTVLGQFHAGHDAIEEGNNHPNERLVLAGRNLRMKRSAANRKNQ